MSKIPKFSEFRYCGFSEEQHFEPAMWLSNISQPPDPPCSRHTSCLLQTRATALFFQGAFGHKEPSSDFPDAHASAPASPVPALD